MKRRAEAIEYKKEGGGRAGGGTIKEWSESIESEVKRERGREQRRREGGREGGRQRRRVMSPLTGSQ